MRNIRWQLLIAVCGIILVVGLLAGQTPPPSISAPQAVPGGAHSEALVGSLLRLNPILDFGNQVDRDVDRLLYSGLVRFDDQGIPQPDLAESWSVSADATLYTFSIREDAVWHDGEPVTAADVIYTFSKLQDDDYPGPSDIHEFWKEVKVILLNDHTVQFQLPEPHAPFLDHLSLGLLPDHLLRGVSATALIDHPFNLDPVGSGPFRFGHFLVEDDQIVGVVLEAFEDYYGQPPFLERVEFHCYPDSASALEAYEEGEVEAIGSVGEDILPQVLADPGLNLYTARLPEIGLVLLNTRHVEKTFFAEQKVRQALLMAINREWLIDRVFEGQAVPADGPILPGNWAFAEDVQPLPFDLERAAQLLETLEWKLPAGAAPGTPEYLRAKDDQTLSFELLYPDEPKFELLAQLLEQSWSAIGVQATLTPVDPSTLLQDYLEPREFEAALTTINLGRYPDPDPYPLWHDTQVETGQNYGGFSDRNISIWLEQARITPDLIRRAELYRSFQFRFRDQVPALLLYYPVYSYAIDSRVLGVAVGPLYDPSDRFASILDWHLLARRGTEPTSIP
jgi:peptide/nickel transport system substrate-binding protein